MCCIFKTHRFNIVVVVVFALVLVVVGYFPLFFCIAVPFSIALNMFARIIISIDIAVIVDIIAIVVFGDKIMTIIQFLEQRNRNKKKNPPPVN